MASTIKGTCDHWKIHILWQKSKCYPVIEGPMFMCDNINVLNFEVQGMCFMCLDFLYGAMAGFSSFSTARFKSCSLNVYLYYYQLSSLWMCIKINVLLCIVIYLQTFYSFLICIIKIVLNLIKKNLPNQG